MVDGLRDALARGDLGEFRRLGKLADAEAQAEADRLAAPGALPAAARWYAQHGVAVFPCVPRQKAPLTPAGFKDASLDPGQVGAWWQRWPTANIGAPTGRTFDVIDIDGPEGVRTWYVMLADAELPPELGRVLTPRPGGHHVYVPVSGRGNGTKGLPGLDYRGSGGYVILPPSVTDEHGTGRHYTWLRPLAV